MELTNYYNLLKIEKSADLNTIKKAFRKEIALYHPDKNKSADARAHFDVLVEAFDILSNTKKREAYDAMMLRLSQSNTPVVIEPKAKEEYKEWKEESKKKSKNYWGTSLTELLLLDIFLDVGFSGLLSDVGDVFEDLGDSLGDIFDIF